MLSRDGINKYSVRGFYILCLLVSVPVYTSGIIGLRKDLKMAFAFLFFAAAGIVIGYILNKKEDIITNKKFICMIIAAVIISASLQGISAYFLAVEPTWDYGIIFKSAYEYVTTDSIQTYTTYFDRYQNNAGIFFLISRYFKLLYGLGITQQVGLLAAGMVLNIVFMQISTVFMALFCRNTFGTKAAVLYLIISTFFMPYIGYAPIFYTDTLSMPFAALALYFFSMCIKSLAISKQVLWGIGISFSLFIGYIIKGSTIIILIAMLIYMLFKLNIKRLGLIMVSVIVPLFLLSMVFSTVVRSVGIIHDDEKKHQYPAEYWIYLGLNDGGIYTQEDDEYCRGLENYDVRKEKMREKIFKQLEDYGVIGLTKHIWEKARGTYSDGTYFASSILARGEPYHENSFIRQLFSVKGKYYSFMRSYQNGYHLLMLVLLMLGMFISLRDKQFTFKALLNIAIFGLTLFLLIWETRARYLLNFTPVMHVLCANTVFELIDMIKRFTDKKGSLKVESDNA